MGHAGPLNTEAGPSTPMTDPALTRKSTRLTSETPSPPFHLPKIDFSTIRSTPLAPRRRFAPTPIKVVEFSRTPAKKGTSFRTPGRLVLGSENEWSRGVAAADGDDDLELGLGLHKLAISDTVLPSPDRPDESIEIFSEATCETHQVAHQVAEPIPDEISSSVLRKAPSLSDLFSDNSPVPSPATRDDSFHSARTTISAHGIQSSPGPSSSFPSPAIRPPPLAGHSTLDSPTQRPYIDVLVSDAEAAASDQGEVEDLGEACSDEDNHDSDEEEDYDLGRHYDDSLGSLRDFIVDDDDEDEYEEGEDDDEQGVDDEERVGSDDNREMEPRRNIRNAKDDPRSKGRIAREVILVSSGSEDVSEAGEAGSTSMGEDEEHDDDLASRKAIRATLKDRQRLVFPDLDQLMLIDAGSESDSDASSTPSTPPRRRKQSTKRAYVSAKSLGRKWEAERVRIALEVFRDLDERVFGGQLGPKGFGANVEWCKRLLTTAGTASFNRKTLPNGNKVVAATIKMSAKVCTGEEQILSTMAHEMCHLATWLISNERKNPHGRIFKSWGHKVMRVRKDIQVTTKHSYQIEYKYQWQCVNAECGHVYKRHSKSIDTSKSRCRICRSALTPLFATKSATPFQTYLKTNMVHAKAAMKGVPHGEVMRALSRRWAEAGTATMAEHGEYWSAMAGVETAT